MILGGSAYTADNPPLCCRLAEKYRHNDLGLFSFDETLDLDSAEIQEVFIPQLSSTLDPR
jgi:hypothetical protein